MLLSLQGFLCAGVIVLTLRVVLTTHGPLLEYPTFITLLIGGSFLFVQPIFVEFDVGFYLTVFVLCRFFGKRPGDSRSAKRPLSLCRLFRKTDSIRLGEILTLPMGGVFGPPQSI